MKLFEILLFLLATVNCLIGQIPYPGVNPGKATGKSEGGNQIILENNVLRMEFVTGKEIKINGFEDKIAHDQLKTDGMPIFDLILKDGTTITSHDFSVVKAVVISDFAGNHDAQVYADRMAGKRCSADLENQKTGFTLHWEAELRDGSNYIRQIFKFNSADTNKISGITLIKFPVNIGVRNEGKVDGSPIVHDNMFFAIEYPLGKVEQNTKFITASLPRLMTEISTTWGVTPKNQLRRGFLYYIERERAHPYHQVLHYNSWYDISWADRKFTEDECLDRIKWFGDSLITKRHVKMKGFLFDDGWDDNKTLWKFHSGFPKGFTNLKKAALSYNSDIGVWLSPFGGYGESQQSRIQYGNKQTPPFETNEHGFALSGPVYFNRFKEATGNFIKDYNVCMFKFDGVGAGNGAGTVYQKDVEAFIRLLKELLKMKPDIYLSLTTGTWPSVYWLKFGDNIWRGGDDTNVMGKGSNRQQWITYRDADTYKNVVQRGPLYPLNSLMLCGICIADYGIPASFEMNDSDISDEIWSFFATGTNLQELYVNPHKLNSANWDCLAAASKWAKENESEMADVHWIGGDPSKEEVYGFAAWSHNKAYISLRNPSDVEKTFEVITSKVFDLPDNVNDVFSFSDARVVGSTAKKQIFAQGKSFRVTLKPFEVKILNAVPNLK